MERRKVVERSRRRGISREIPTARKFSELTDMGRGTKGKADARQRFLRLRVLA
jgi:hypothetical protein